MFCVTLPGLEKCGTDNRNLDILLDKSVPAPREGGKKRGRHRVRFKVNMEGSSTWGKKGG